jgi:tripartite-type tricarboxylate transporter receptor subunit TctC
MRLHPIPGALLALTFLLSAGVKPASAQETFFKGKTVRFIVGGSAGGGYDTYTRAIARHIGRHVPGNPTFVVENMTGAGTLISANFVYNVAKPDGLTIGHFVGGLMLQQVLGKPGIQFDGPKFQFLGAPAQDTIAAGIAKSTGITTVEQWQTSKTQLKFGGVGPGAATDDATKVFRATIGVPVQIISGYKGTADIRLAVNSGELQGVTNSWESFKSTWTQEIKSGAVVVVLLGIAQRHPDIPNVPSIGEFVKNEDARKLIEVAVYDYGALARPYVMPPATPKDRVRILRKALADTLKDPEFLADAQKARLDLNPISGEEMERVVARTYGLEKSLVEKLKEILK